jgi:hypothetical protein
MTPYSRVYCRFNDSSHMRPGSQPKLKRTNNALVLKRYIGIASDGGGDQPHDNVLRFQLFFSNKLGPGSRADYVLDIVKNP